MTKSKIYVCPVCGNVIFSSGEAVVSCCGIRLPAQEAEASPAGAHQISIEIVEDEYYVTLPHPMTKEHYISFIAAAGADSIQLTKLYPEQNAEARFKIAGVHKIYAYCNKDGLFEVRV